MEVLVLIGAVLSLVAVLLRRSAMRHRAQTTLHQIADTAAAHRALNEKASAFSNRPAAIFPVVLATGLHGERNENITTVDYGPHWRALRCNLTAKILHPSRLGSLAPIQREATQALVAVLSAQARDGADGAVLAVRDPINAAVFGLVARLCFGDGVHGHQMRAMELVIQGFIISMGELNPVFDGSTLCKLMNWRRLGRLFTFLGRQTKLFLPLINARRKPEFRVYSAGGIVDPYVDSLLDLRVPDNNDAGGEKHGDDVDRRALRDDELVSLVSEFLGAGSGSVVACLEWTLAHLVDKPDVQDRLRREIDGETINADVLSTKTLRRMPYLNAVVLESLRMHPPVPFILRGVHGEDAAVVGATAVPTDGLRVQFNAGKIGRDGKTWTDPDEFRPERFLAGGEAEGIGPTPGPKEIRMMPFGAAHRHCPGTSLAMVHIKCFLAALVREFEWAPSAEDCAGGVDLTELDGFFKVMKKPLLAHVRPRTRSCAV